jgi:hypothetical protein
MSRVPLSVVYKIECDLVGWKKILPRAVVKLEADVSMETQGHDFGENFSSFLKMAV